MAKTAKKKKAAPIKRTPKAADAEIDAKQAKAYGEMEPYVCDVVKMGRIA